MAKARVGWNSGASYKSISGVLGTFTWGKEYFASAGTRNVSYPTRLIAPVTDVYYINLSVAWYPRSGGNQRKVSIIKNGVTPLALTVIVPQAALGQPVDCIRLFSIEKLTTGDYIEAMFYQDSGVDINFFTGEALGENLPTFGFSTQ